MKSFRVSALSADRDFLSLLRAHDFHASLHSRFNRVINLQRSQDNQLYTLACSALDNAPNTLIVDITDFKPWLLNNSIGAVLNNQTLQLGEVLTIDFSHCRLWLPSPVYYSGCSPSYLTEVNRELVRWIISVDSTSLFYYHGENVFYREINKQLVETRGKLINGLRGASTAAITAALCGFIGLGIGLTPSADDYLVGLCAVLALKNHPGRHFLPLFAQAIAESESRTTKVSHMAMMKAVQGETRESISALLAAIFNPGEIALKERIRPVINIGSSSGADILCGISDGLLLSIYLEKQHANQDFDQKEHLF